MNENKKTEDTRMLLVLQMKRAIELLENADLEKFFWSKEVAELERKMHEIRRDSIRFMKEVRPWR